MLDKNYNALNFFRTVSRHEMIKIHLDATSLHFFYHSKVLVFMNTKKTFLLLLQWALHALAKAS